MASAEVGRTFYDSPYRLGISDAFSGEHNDGPCVLASKR